MEKMYRRKSFKFPQELLDNLNVLHNKESGLLVFWNKYQIFLMEETKLDTHGDFSNWRLECNTDFEVHRLILAKHLLCLDYKGSLFAYTLTQTASHQKRPRQDFQHLGNNFLCIESYEDFLISLKLEMDELFIGIDKFISNDNVNLIIKKYSANKIASKNVLLPSEIKREECVLCCYQVEKSDFDSISLIFKGKEKSQYQQFIVIMSFNRLVLYAVLVDLEFNENVLTPVKLLTSPSKICSITIIKEDCLHVIITLISGTVVKQPLNKKTPNIAYLNTAIHKSTVLNNKIIYSDCSTMWVSVNTFSETESKLKQLFIKNVKDFIIFDDVGKIICTTYSKVIYIFNLKDESSYLVPVTTKEYYSAQHLLNNMHYMHKIMEEVEKNNEIINNIKKEENHITTLALSNRHDIMQEIIKCTVNVYEHYQDVLKEDLMLNLTNKVEDYFVKDLFCFLIKVYLAKEQNFDDLLENIFTDTKIHITILSAQQIIKTFCVKVLNHLNNFNILIPLKMNMCNLTDVCLDVKIVKKIPKVFNCKHNLWTALYCMQITVTPEHFIKTNHSAHNVHVLKDSYETIETLLYKTAQKYHGHLYRITKSSEDLLTWSFYIKLPSTYKEFLKNETFYNDYFESVKAKYLMKEISSGEFINSRKSISFSVANDKFELQIIDDGFSNPLTKNMMKVSCVNPILALEIRNFFSNLVHNNYLQYKPRQEFLNNSKIILSLEKIEKEVQKCIDERQPFEEFLKLYDRYQISLCGTLV